MLLIRGPHFETHWVWVSQISVALNNKTSYAHYQKMDQRRDSDHRGSSVFWPYLNARLSESGGLLPVFLVSHVAVEKFSCLDFLSLISDNFLLWFYLYPWKLFTTLITIGLEFHNDVFMWLLFLFTALSTCWMLSFWKRMSFWEIFLNYFFDVFIPFISALHSFWDSYLSANWV